MTIDILGWLRNLDPPCKWYPEHGQYELGMMHRIENLAGTPIDRYRVLAWIALNSDGREYGSYW